MDTHYVPGDAEKNGMKLRAACQRWVRPEQHAQTPSCAECRTWQVEDAATIEDVIEHDQEGLGRPFRKESHAPWT